MRLLILFTLALWLSTCSAPPPSLPPRVSDDNPTPEVLTGLAKIDDALEPSIRVLYARGNARIEGQAANLTANALLPMNSWLITESGTELEMISHTAQPQDGIIRLGADARFLVEPDQFRLYSGQVSFFFPSHFPVHLQVITPSGRLLSRGGVFTISLSPDQQVLVTCREGSVAVLGQQNSVALPGQVLVLDRWGRSRVYAMAPNDAFVFQDHWQIIAGEEAPAALHRQLPDLLIAWPRLQTRLNQNLAPALWLDRAELLVVGLQLTRQRLPQAELGALPSNEELQTTWHRLASLRQTEPLRRWAPELDFPGLLGDLP